MSITIWLFFIVPYLVENMPAHVGGVEVRGKGRKAMRLRMQSCVVLSGTLRILNSCLMYTSLNKYTLYHGGVLWLWGGPEVFWEVRGDRWKDPTIVVFAKCSGKGVYLLRLKRMQGENILLLFSVTEILFKTLQISFAQELLKATVTEDGGGKSEAESKR